VALCRRLFLTATTLATLLGLCAANVFKPGAGLNLDLFRDAMGPFDAKKNRARATRPPAARRFSTMLQRRCSLPSLKRRLARKNMPP
jgi:hypothetical protein